MIIRNRFTIKNKLLPASKALNNEFTIIITSTNTVQETRINVVDRGLPTILAAIAPERYIAERRPTKTPFNASMPVAQKLYAIRIPVSNDKTKKT